MCDDFSEAEVDFDVSAQSASSANSSLLGQKTRLESSKCVRVSGQRYIVGCSKQEVGGEDREQRGVIGITSL